MQSIISGIVGIIDLEADTVKITEKDEDYQVRFFKIYSSQAKAAYCKDGKYKEMCKKSMKTSIREKCFYGEKSTTSLNILRGEKGQRVVDAINATKDYSSKNIMRLIKEIHEESISIQCLWGRLSKLVKLGRIEVISEPGKPKIINVLPYKRKQMGVV